MKIQFAPKEFELNGNIIKHNHCVYMIPFDIPVYFVNGQGILFGNNVPLKDMKSFWCKCLNKITNDYSRQEHYCYSKEDYIKLISYLNNNQYHFEKFEYIPE
jgi:hypothetical protein